MTNHTPAPKAQTLETAGRSGHVVTQLLLATLFGGTLSLAFLDQTYFWAAWVAFVPLLFAIDSASMGRTYLVGVVAGLVTFTTGKYWILDFILLSKNYSFSISVAFASLYWLYCSQVIALGLLLYQWLKKQTNVHEFFLFPLLLATVFAVYPMLFAIRLGESQTLFFSALQATEWFGDHGLDIVILLGNVMLFRLFYNLFEQRGRIFKCLNGKRYGQTLTPWVLGCAVLVAWFSYGGWAFNVWERSVSNWPTTRIGIIQPNEIPRYGKKQLYPGYSYSYPPEMEMSERLSQLETELIVWPEGQHKGYLDQTNTQEAYANAVKNMGVALLFQDMQHQYDAHNGQLNKRKSAAVMLSADGALMGVYQKIKRIPFGEYAPLAPEGSLLRRWLETLFGEFLTVLEAGERPAAFLHTLNNQDSINIVPLICYETTFPEFVGDAVYHSNKQAKQNFVTGTIVFGLTNDGWFGSTHQPYQHILPSVIRAVENRVPFVHVANNGPSIVVAPSGRIIFQSDSQVPGGFIVNVPYSNIEPRRFLGHQPHTLFLYLMCLVVLMMMALGLYCRRYGRV